MQCVIFDPNGVSQECWKIHSDPLRVGKLNNSPNSLDLLNALESNVIIAIQNNKIRLDIVHSVDKQGFLHAEVEIDVEPDFYDFYFNGRCGLRAQYYLSADHGEDYHKASLSKIIYKIQNTFGHNCVDKKKINQFNCSLKEKYTKIGLWGHEAYEENIGLITKRWGDKTFGNKLLRIDKPIIEIKGTFLNEDCNESWLCETKVKRAHTIHENGFA